MAKKAKKPAKRFKVWINEGAFFHEPWVSDTTTGKDYRYNDVPPAIRVAFAQELLDRQRATPDEFRLIIDFVINHTKTNRRSR